MNLWTKTMLVTGSVFSYGALTGTPEHTEHMRCIFLFVMADATMAGILSLYISEAMDLNEVSFDYPWSANFNYVQSLIQLTEGTLH